MAKLNSILIIEDDRFIGEMYTRSLKNAGYQVDWLVTGPEGANAATKTQYDLILLDIMLPGTQGDDILSCLRGSTDDKVPNSRIIVLTNYDQTDEAREAMVEKVDAYLIKADITPRKLLGIIDNMRPIESS